MITISEKRFHEIFSNARGKKILVIGDLMLDHYIWGQVIRVSPEAPVPVVEVEAETTRLGGAANVVNNIAMLDAEPIPVGVVGDDDFGKTIRRLLEEQNFLTAGLMIDPDRATTVKTRVIAHNQHVVRVDRENKTDINGKVAEHTFEFLKKMVPICDALLIEDYNKGMLTKEVIHEIIKFARQGRKIVTVDPKYHNFFEYKNVTVFKPNRREAEEALGIRLNSDREVEEYGKQLMDKLECENILITRSEQGMTLIQKDGSIEHVPTKARKIHDVSGAGDTVISTLTVGLASGANIKEAATLANFAASVVVGEVGIVAITIEKLKKAIFAHSDYFNES